MRFGNLLAVCLASVFLMVAVDPVGAAVYLNISNISVEVGSGTSPGSFNNTYSGGTIDKVIDAPSATATEFHDQTTHIWFTSDAPGGGLELRFDFGREYDITDLHFWNYTSEAYDVDNIDFTFFNGSGLNVGTLSVQPELGSSPGIAAQDIALLAPLNVRTVNAFLTGTNQQVDFQNIGFTASVSTVPEPSSFLALGLAVGIAGLSRRRRR
ncbi:MAG: PEP-CTERM sorting domain-containing protein [Rubripirellula sp.]